MKIIKVAAILLISIISNNLMAQKTILKSAKIEWESFSTESIYDIGCDQFDYSFLNSKQNETLTNKAQLAKLNLLTAYNLFTPEKKYKSIDVRGKLILAYKNSTIKYCFDQFGHFYYNDKLLNNKNLWAFITKIIPKSDQ